MNLEELAREAGVWAIPGALLPPSKIHNERLTHFAALVLEEAAKAAENTPTCLLPSGAFLSERCAAAIRALKPGTSEQEPDDATEDLYDRLHSLSKSLESSGRLDEHDNPGAYATVLDAMNYVRRGTVAT